MSDTIAGVPVPPDSESNRAGIPGHLESQVPSPDTRRPAGAMIWLVAADLVPEALETAKPWTVAYTMTASGAAMLAFVLLLF